MLTVYYLASNYEPPTDASSHVQAPVPPSALSSTLGRARQTLAWTRRSVQGAVGVGRRIPLSTQAPGHHSPYEAAGAGKEAEAHHGGGVGGGPGWLPRFRRSKPAERAHRVAVPGSGHATLLLAAPQEGVDGACELMEDHVHLGPEALVPPCSLVPLSVQCPQPPVYSSASYTGEPAPWIAALLSALYFPTLCGRTDPC